MRRHGGDAYREKVEQARPYLDFVLDRAAGRHNVKDPTGRVAFLNEMLGVAARIPEALARVQFADRLAIRAHVAEDTIRQEIRKAAVTRQATLPDTARRASVPGVTWAERELIVGVMTTPGDAVLAMDALEEGDLEPLRTGRLLRLVLSMDVQDPAHLPGALLARLTEEERRWVTGLTMSAGAVAPPRVCVEDIQRQRLKAAQASVQQEIDLLQEAADPVHLERLNALYRRKLEIGRQLKERPEEPK